MKKKVHRSKKTEFKKANKKAKTFGRPKLTDEQKALRLTARKQTKDLMGKYMIHTPTELRKLKRSTKTPAVDRVIIQSILNAVDSGSQSSLDWFYDSTIGKEKETTNIKLTGEMSNTSKIDLTKLTAEELLALKAIAEKSEGSH